MGTIKFTQDYSQVVHVGQEAVWNVNDKASTVTISNGGRTMASATAPGGAVRSTRSRYRGKFYLEYTLDSCPGGFAGSVGFGTISRTLTDGQSYLLAGYFQTNNGIWYQEDNFGTINMAAVTTGNTVGITGDLDNNRFWITCSRADGSGGGFWDSWNNISGNVVSYSCMNPASPSNTVVTNIAGGEVFLMALGCGTDSGGTGPFGVTLNTLGPFLNPNYSTIRNFGYGLF